MELTDKIVLAHRGFFNKECQSLYRENSMEVCSVSSTKEYIGMIELDVRKSKDGILYCYHGTLYEYCCGLKFPKDFLEIQKKYGVDSLVDILDVIDNQKIVFLDIKDHAITKEDIANVFKNRDFKEVILANSSVTFLDRFSDMPKLFVKILNINVFCNFYDLERLKDKNFKYFEVLFPFQARKNIIERVQKAGMEFHCAGLFFLSKRSYWNKIHKYSIKYISSDYI